MGSRSLWTRLRNTLGRDVKSDSKFKIQDSNRNSKGPDGPFFIAGIHPPSHKATADKESRIQKERAVPVTAARAASRREAEPQRERLTTFIYRHSGRRPGIQIRMPLQDPTEGMGMAISIRGLSMDPGPWTLKFVSKILYEFLTYITMADRFPRLIPGRSAAW